MDYYSVAEIETATANLAAKFPTLARLIVLPHVTAEGRTSRALHLGAATNKAKPALMITGGVHAAEWGSCEIVLNLAVDLLAAYSRNLPLTYGGKTFSKVEVRNLLDTLDVIIFPLVNPDGRQFSRTTMGQTQWRKNRNPASADDDPMSVGVDINRNFKFLFNLDAFVPGTVSASTNPMHSTFQGGSAESEPETRNVKWLLDEYPQTCWFIDIHAPGQTMRYVWGDDEPQDDDSSMNFTDHDYDGARGEPSQGYREYLEAADLVEMQRLARCFATDLNAVANTTYGVGPAFTFTPYSGTSHDYAYSRHLADKTKAKVLGFFVEWGDANCQPDWLDMEPIIKEVCAGLIGFGIAAVR